MSVENKITKETLDYYLKELAKEFRKRNGTKTPAEIIMVGGAAIIANYGFRESTQDIDAIISANSAMKESINVIGDRLNLPNGWINSDFIRTNSYTSKLVEVSKYYRTYSNILFVRTINAEYLVAMKLMSCRQYRRDLSDIIGIIKEQQEKGKPLTYECISNAVHALYGGWDNISFHAIHFLKEALESRNLPELYAQLQNKEDMAKDALIKAKKSTTEPFTEESVDYILNKISEQTPQKLSLDELIAKAESKRISGKKMEDNNLDNRNNKLR